VSLGRALEAVADSQDVILRAGRELRDKQKLRHESWLEQLFYYLAC
jgi:hypothetical protein